MDKYVIRKCPDSNNDCAAEEVKVKKPKTEQQMKGTVATKDRYSATRFFLEEVKGDLFSCGDDESLAHCISEDVRMGKGIAVLFKKKFGGVNELLKQGQKPGGVAVLQRANRYVYYLVTKEKYWNKPTYSSLRSSLEAMRDHCNTHKVTKLSMPRIGCGLDGLQWNKVLELIKDVFRETDVKITVYTL